MATLSALPESLSTVGQEIRRLRQARGLSLRGLARLAGISASALSRWEAEKRLPNIPELDAVLNALETSEPQKRAVLRLINAPRAVQRLRAFGGDAPSYLGGGGDLLWAMRQRNGWTQAQTAQAAGVTQAQIARWESGDVWPDAAHLHRVCWCLNAGAKEIAALTGIERGEALSGVLPNAAQKWDEEAWRNFVVRLLFYPPPDATVELTLIATEQHLLRRAYTAAYSGFAPRLLAHVYAIHARHYMYRGQNRQAAFWGERGIAQMQTLTASGLRPDGEAFWFGSVLASASYAGQNKRPSGLHQAVRVLQKWLPALDARDSHFSWGHISLARHLNNMGRTKEAVAIANSVCQKAEHEAPIESFLRRRDFAGILLDAGQPVRALRVLESLHFTNATSPDTVVRTLVWKPSAWRRRAT